MAKRKIEPRKPITGLDLDRNDAVSTDVAKKKPTLPVVATSAADAGDAEETPDYIRLGEERRLTKKDKSRLRSWKGSQRGKALDKFFTRRVEGARNKFGHASVYLGSEAKKLCVVIPMFAGHEPEVRKHPGCLPLEYITGSDGFPLGIISQIVGKPGTCKSAFIAELLRFFDLAGGGGEVEECETKHSPEWYQAVMGPEAYSRFQLNRCDSVEDWQRRLTFSIRDTKAYMDGTKKVPGPGRIFPFCLAVDTIMGKMSEDTQEKILGEKLVDGKRGTTGEGAADRSHPLEAMKITYYMKSIPGELDGWPFSIVLANHLKEGKDEMGHKERKTGGGAQVNFQETLELELTKLGGHKKKIDCEEFEGLPIEISCEKSSLGPTHRRIHTRVLWWWDKTKKNRPQKAIWDWDWSTVWLLDNLLNGKGASTLLRSSLSDINFHIDCPKRGDVDNSAWSKSLGMKEGDALPWHEVGAQIRQNHELQDQLRKALMIQHRPVLAGDYLEQLDQVADTML